MTGSLFGPEEDASLEQEVRASAPLADRMRPGRVEDFVGQTELLGPGGILEHALAGRVSQSLILWGPPGSGKTTLARLIARASSMRFVPFSAVLSGIKEVRTVMLSAEVEFKRSGQRTLLFVDEIHRFNKAQQDAFLPFVERGDILLIGATTENPSFELNGALLSRARTLILKPLGVEELVLMLEHAVQAERGLDGRVQLDEGLLTRIAHAADGDARRALNILETAAALAPEGGHVDAELLARALQTKVLAYDKSGEEHYNLISALHKSIRNSDDNAALYWLARMLRSGEDRKYLARRLVRMALEDIGLADPSALRVTLDCADAWHRLGSPEGEIALAQAAVYLARAPKSDALYKALASADEDIEQAQAEAVPAHLRNPVTDLMRRAGYGKGYRSAHEDPAARAEMTCMPPALAQRRYFGPDPEG